MKKTMAIVGLTLWIFGSGWYYTCKIKDCCYNGSSPGQTQADLVQSGYPVLFDLGSDKPLKGAGFTVWKDSLTQLAKPGNAFQITGLFSPSEKNQTSEKDLGLARAKMVRALFPEIPDSMITLKSMEESGLSSADGSPVPALLAEIIVAEKTNAPGATMRDVYIIYFPSNSVEKVANPQTDQYLNDLVTTLKNASKTVEVIGHTDNIGPDEVNYSMGLLRAEAIRSALVARGFPVARISVSSKGEKQPVGMNDTDENRAKNRRTEIVVK